jgi:hypothetical protein
VVKDYLEYVEDGSRKFLGHTGTNLEGVTSHTMGKYKAGEAT